ncbi:Hpt domain-containing protein [Roseateles oligotrophus]|uniref:Hpt domain-containing protein n=1 Tax=Roseateles oligotrophus TaxID=1769250 RepID=A0ABT2YJV7_9BURK|nr:Hpt domain-containing protein [Roseateles oligotrophus]MCV2370210.1 Hpt domain-containing protein [Roseateles oligotrophus]
MTSSSNSVSNSNAIDLPTFTDLQGAAGVEFVVELTETFLEEAPQQIQALHQALRCGDQAAFRRAAHTLKSNGSTFGALAFSALARELELSKLSDLGAEGALMLQRLEDEYRLAAQALKELCHAT